MTRKVGQMWSITSIVEAAEFIMNEWPGENTKRLKIAKHGLVECFDGNMSPGVARMASIEAAKEIDIYIDSVGRPRSTGKLERWHRTKLSRRA